jgi:hypothetical protein
MIQWPRVANVELRLIGKNGNAEPRCLSAPMAARIRAVRSRLRNPMSGQKKGFAAAVM